MKKVKLSSLFALVLAIVFLTGCSKDDDKPSAPEGYVAPVNVTQEEIVKVPAAIENSTEPNLAYAKGMLASINGYSSLIASLAVPAGAELVETKSTTKTWRWTNGEFTMWVEFTEESLSYKWVLYYQGTQYFPTKTKVMEATQTKLGTSGVIKIYYGFEAAIVTYSWEKVGSTVNATLLYNFGDEGALMTVSVDDDGSGEFDMYQGLTISSPHVFHVEWDTAAHGSWWVKDVEGVNEYSGEF